MITYCKKYIYYITLPDFRACTIFIEEIIVNLINICCNKGHSGDIIKNLGQKPPDKKAPRQKPPGQKPPDNKPPA